MSQEKEKRVSVPMTIITGFLGSGKTTLVNTLLDQLVQQKKKVAIVQNEFSDKGVEEGAKTVQADDGSPLDNLLELPNGCLCCTAKDNFMAGLEALLSRRSFDYILVECSGMVDPGPVISQLWVDEELEMGVYLDGVVTLVDSFYFVKDSDKSKDQSEQVIHQVSYADIILVNKTDIVSPEISLAVEGLVRQYNPTCSLIRTSFSKCDVSEILFQNKFKSQSALNFSASHSHEECKKDEIHCVHDSGISSLILTAAGTLAKPRVTTNEQIMAWLAGLLWESNEHEIFRMKGIINVDGKPKWLQCVQELFELKPTDKSKLVLENKLVVIGKKLDEDRLVRDFNSLFEVT